VAAVNRSVLNAMKVAAVVLVACWLVSNATSSIAERTYSKHEKRVLEFAKRKEQQADSLESLADALARQRDSLAVVASEKQKTIIKRIESAREVPVPAEAKPLVDTLNAIIDDQNELLVIQGREVKLGREIEAKLRGALSASNMRGDSLLYLVNLPKPKAPRASVGIFVGPCATQTGAYPFCAGVGVSWRIL
jgi:hypothetical protein